MGAVGYLTGYQGKEATSRPAQKSSPLHRTIHQTLGNVCYGLLVWAGLNQLYSSSINSLEMFQAVRPLRFRYFLCHFYLGR